MAMTLTPSRLRVTQAKFFGDYNAGGSGVTSLASGLGIDLTPDPIINTGTIALITPVTPTLGGTGSDLSATGGAGQYVKQVGVGANFTVGTIPSTDIGAGFVKVNGTTPLTADWPAGAFKVTTGTLAATAGLSVNATAPVAKTTLQYQSTDQLVNQGGAGADWTQARVLSVVDGKDGVGNGVTNSNFSEMHQRFDEGNPGWGNVGLIPYLYYVKKTSGNGNLSGLFSRADYESTDVSGSSGVVAVTGSAWTTGGSPAGANSRTSYSFWGQSARFFPHTRAVGMELDVTNAAGVDAFWAADIAHPPDGDVNSTIGLAINGMPGNKNSVGLTFQCPPDGQWKTGIIFADPSIGVYAIDAAPMVSGQIPLRIAHNASIVARDVADTGDYGIIKARGLTNVAVGASAMATAGAGGANTAVGSQALLANTTGANNTGIGSNALANTVGGTENTAVGSLALAANTSGNYNTAVGVNALANVTTNTDNTALGYHAAYATTAGAITAVGSGALAANTSGGANTAVGYHALQTVTTTSYNTAVGSAALAAATGAGNTAVGNGTALLTTSGQYNTAIGIEALRSNLTGQSNVAVGANAGRYETGSEAFYVNNRDRTNTAGDKTLSLLYGIMAAAAANQKLTVNGLFKLGVIPPAYANNAAALAGGLLAGDLYVVTGSDPRQLAIVF